VTHKRSGRSIVVRINDRGPFIRGRIIDLSRGAKRQLGMGGLAPVCLKILSSPKKRRG
jgi:rare lipoprotein A